MLQGNFFFLLNNWNTMMKQRIIIGFLCICLASMAFAQERIRIEHGPYSVSYTHLTLPTT